MIVTCGDKLGTFALLFQGTSPGGVDVREYVHVGVTNMAVATGLTLHDGLTYYVTVRGVSSVP